MKQTPYIFNQLINYLPKDVFDRLVKKNNGNAHAKDYTCWNHLLVMIWAQFTSRRSLRDIEISLRAHSDKIYRMGIGKNISRNNIAHANAVRDVSIYRDYAEEMMLRAAKVSIRDQTLLRIGKTFGLNGFFAIDSSTVSLDLNKYRWSVPQQDLGGIKIHTMYDLMRGVPRMCMITGHEERDQTFMEDYPYESGCFYMIDRLYFKTRGLSVINSKGAYFIIRLKKNVMFETVERREVEGIHVLADDTIRFTSRWAKEGYGDKLRRVRFYSSERNELLDFVTNNFELDAATIALLYKYRWQIEFFFKWVKQHLRITAFYGTSANAVMIQVYTAFIAFCVIALAADAFKYEGSLYEFSNLISLSLTEKVHLQDLIERSFLELKEESKDGQLSLFDFDKMSF